MIAIPEHIRLSWLPRRRRFGHALVGAVLLTLGGLAFVGGFATSALRTARKVEERPLATPSDLRPEFRWFEQGQLGLALALIGCGFLLVRSLGSRGRGEWAGF